MGTVDELQQAALPADLLMVCCVPRLQAAALHITALCGVHAAAPAAGATGLADAGWTTPQCKPCSNSVSPVPAAGAHPAGRASVAGAHQHPPTGPADVPCGVGEARRDTAGKVPGTTAPFGHIWPH